MLTAHLVGRYAVVLSLLLSSSIFAQTERVSPRGVIVRIAAAPALVTFVAPAPPPSQRRNDASVGKTTALVSIRPDGYVANVEPRNPSDTSFWQETEAALRQWRYAPATAAAQTMVEVEFQRQPPHNAADVLLDTPTFRVTADANQSEWCFRQPDRTQANINVIVRGGADEVLGQSSPAYRARIEQQVLPAVEKACAAGVTLFISNYLDGVRVLSNEHEEVPAAAALGDGQRERAINELMVSRDAAGAFAYLPVGFDKAESLTALRTLRGHVQLVALAASTPAAASASPAAPRAATAPVPSAPRAAASASTVREPPASVLPPLNVEGLSHERIIKAMYRGQFERVAMIDPTTLALISDDGLIGRKVFAGYVEAFAHLCPQFLSDRKVQLTLVITHGENDPDPQRIDTAIFVEPEFATAYIGLYSSGGFEGLVSTWRDIAAGRAKSFPEAAQRLITEVLEIVAEMHELIDRHGCDSPQIKRFAANALAYVRPLDTPPYQFAAFQYYCTAEIAKIVPGARPASCGCLEGTFRRTLEPWRRWRLEDEFTEQRFLTTAVSKVGLPKELAACF